ncbi:MAG: hypothetical protein RLZ25_1430 [Pseudomonadota bacterium]
MNKISAHDKERGTIIPLMALAMTGMLGMVGLSVDGGFLLTSQSELQTAADSAALKGASQLGNPGSNNAPIPNFSLASSTVPDALVHLGNVSAGRPVTEATITTGGWDMTQANKGLQPWIANSGLIPAVKVTVAKSGANGIVNSTFLRVLGLTGFSPVATAVAIGDYGPGSAKPGQLAPIILSQCVMDQIWDPVTNAPLLAKSAAPFCTGCPNNTVGKPIIVRIFSQDPTSGNGGKTPNYGSSSPSCSSTGSWTTYASNSNSDADINTYLINGYPNKVSIGDQAWVTSGVKNASNKTLAGLIPYAARVALVKGAAVAGTSMTISGFACVKIQAVDSTTSVKSFDLTLLGISNSIVTGVSNTNFSCELATDPGSAVSNNTYITAPPRIVN